MNQSDRNDLPGLRRVLAGALCAAMLVFALTGCQPMADHSARQNPQPTGGKPSQSADLPDIPDDLDMENGVPMLTVYDVQNDRRETMDIERYVMGVLAGEMKNDWPLEALKAQAILARTFVLKFVDEKDSKYEDADISTDIKEAQAYNAEAVNERIEQAVNETRGEVLSEDGDLPYAWFHAHAGGMTELATKALDYKKEEPSYTHVVESPDSDKAPDNVKQWSATFSASEVARAAKESGVEVDEIESIELGEKGESGRSVYFLLNGQKVSAPSLRIHLDSQKLKSTLISDVSLNNGEITFTGSGYGHGVGMSQWGAYGMAEEGRKAEEIVEHYFKNVEVVKLW